jgi:hypothetical protein
MRYASRLKQELGLKQGYIEQDASRFVQKRSDCHNGTARANAIFRI